MSEPASKGAAKPVVRQKRAQPGTTPKTVLPGSAQASDMNLPAKRVDVTAARLAQMVNLHIAGYSLSQIGDALGCTAEEVDRILAQDVSRYVRSQPALRVYVRNWISERYGKLLEADWDEATDKTHPKKLENQDRAMRILDRMAKLHGADAPVQQEITIDSAPEAVEKLVQVLSQAQGLGYDEDIFDVVDAEIIHEMVEELHEKTEASDVESEADDETL